VCHLLPAHKKVHMTLSCDVMCTPFPHVQRFLPSFSVSLSLSFSLPFSPLLLVFASVIFLSFLPVTYAFPAMNPPLPSPTSPFSPMSFCTVSINVNGLSNPIKINAIQNVASTLRPMLLLLVRPRLFKMQGPGCFYLTTRFMRTQASLEGHALGNAGS
jgi:hypothetical protein